MRPQPLICVRDVESSSRWYQHLLGCRGAHGGRHYEQLVIGQPFTAFPLILPSRVIYPKRYCDACVERRARAQVLDL